MFLLAAHRELIEGTGVLKTAKVVVLGTAPYSGEAENGGRVVTARLASFWHLAFCVRENVPCLPLTIEQYRIQA